MHTCVRANLEIRVDPFSSALLGQEYNDITVLQRRQRDGSMTFSGSVLATSHVEWSPDEGGYETRNSNKTKVSQRGKELAGGPIERATGVVRSRSVRSVYFIVPRVFLVFGLYRVPSTLFEIHLISEIIAKVSPSFCNACVPSRLIN